MDEINRDNCRLLLAGFIEKNILTTHEVAKAIGCSDATLARILVGATQPSDEMLKQTGILMEIKFQAYEKLSAGQKEKLSEGLGAVGGGAVGFGAITAAVSTFGIIPGLSAAGITSGLATIGSIVGGGMIAGVSVAAAIPLVAGTVGYSIIKAVKYFVSERQLNSKELDPRFEIEKECQTTA